MIFITNSTQSIKFNESQTLNMSYEMRGSLSKTTDGGAFVNNNGVHTAGMEFQVNTVLSKEKTALLKSIVEASERVFISTNEGAFLGYIKKFTNKKGSVTITLWTIGEG